MSSGHTWHWGTPERSYQIPLGKPGLVIPRCETPASRSVTFSLHQRKALHSNPPLPPFFLPWGSAIEGPEEKKAAWRRRERTLFISPPLQSSSSEKGSGLCVFPSASCYVDPETIDHQHIFTIRCETLCWVAVFILCKQQADNLVSSMLGGMQLLVWKPVREIESFW